MRCESINQLKAIVWSENFNDLIDRYFSAIYLRLETEVSSAYGSAIGTLECLLYNEVSSIFSSSFCRINLAITFCLSVLGLG
jgi:hypothetical protein